MNRSTTRKSYRFSLELSREVALSYYSGKTRAIRVRSDSGEIVQFPASALRAFVTETGVRGSFEVTVSAENRLISFRKIG